MVEYRLFGGSREGEKKRRQRRNKKTRGHPLKRKKMRRLIKVPTCLADKAFGLNVLRKKKKARLLVLWLGMKVCEISIQKLRRDFQREE